MKYSALLELLREVLSLSEPESDIESLVDVLVLFESLILVLSESLINVE